MKEFLVSDSLKRYAKLLWLFIYLRNNGIKIKKTMLAFEIGGIR
jgi:hypothetical protein